MAQITTVYTYPLDSSRTEFPIPFEYLARRFVSITLIGADRKKLVLGSEYRFISSTLIKTTKAWGAADNYDYIEVKRETSASDRIVTFQDGSILRATDLNLAQIQTMHVAEEARNAVTDTIGVDTNGQLDARARRIVNVADAINPGDAITYRQVLTWNSSALNQANRAESEANKSASSASASATSASNSAGSASSAATSASNAAGANAAAAASRDTTKGYMDTTSGYKDAAATSSAFAQAWATKAEDTVISGTTQYSALHHASKAAKSATAAATSASTATAQADRAKTEADKLGNMNTLGGAISAVAGTQVVWKGWQSTADGGFQARLGADAEANFSMTDAAGNDPIRLVRTADRTVHLYGNASGDGTRMSWTATAVATPKTFNANGALNVQGAATFNGTSLFKSGNVQVFAPSAEANAHLWFYNPDGTTRGIFYCQQSGQVTLQTGNAVSANFKPDGSAAFNYITFGGCQSQGTLLVQRSGGAPAAGMYNNSHFQAQTVDGTPPSYAWHRGGSYALAMYLTGGNELNIIDSAGYDRAMVNSGNLGAWMITVGGEGVGSYAFCRSNVTATYGTDVAGANLTYGSTSSSGGAPPGTWRSRGWAGGGAHTLFQRVA